jgi:hypothetical protein
MLKGQRDDCSPKDARVRRGLSIVSRVGRTEGLIQYAAHPVIDEAAVVAHLVFVTGIEKPNTGTDGSMLWKESAGSCSLVSALQSPSVLDVTVTEVASR